MTIGAVSSRDTAVVGAYIVHQLRLFDAIGRWPLECPIRNCESPTRTVPEPGDAAKRLVQWPPGGRSGDRQGESSVSRFIRKVQTDASEGTKDAPERVVVEPIGQSSKH